jgi:hypothetical protein
MTIHRATALASIVIRSSVSDRLPTRLTPRCLLPHPNLRAVSSDARVDGTVLSDGLRLYFSYELPAGAYAYALVVALVESGPLARARIVRANFRGRSIPSDPVLFSAA